MLECVVNVSEGVDLLVLDELKAACRTELLDTHIDPFHNRSVFTLAGENVLESAQRLTTTAIELLDITRHAGVHPRIGVVDVVPFVPLPGTSATLDDAVRAQIKFAHWLVDAHDVPCFLYGEKRSLPEVRRASKSGEKPDIGPFRHHPTAGACAVGARDVLIAYNLWLKEKDLELAKNIAKSIRQLRLRSLGLEVGDHVQVSCNLLEPATLGPSDVYDLVAQHAEIQRTELVGLIPQGVLDATPQSRWQQLDLDADRTIESRLTR